jgi:hypothetical protein
MRARISSFSPPLRFFLSIFHLPVTKASSRAYGSKAGLSDAVVYVNSGRISNTFTRREQNEEYRNSKTGDLDGASERE